MGPGLTRRESRPCSLCGEGRGVRSFRRTEAVRLHGSDLHASFLLCPRCAAWVRTAVEGSDGLYRLAEGAHPGRPSAEEVVSALWAPAGASPQLPAGVPDSLRKSVEEGVLALRSRLGRNPEMDELMLHLLQQSALGDWMWRTVYAVACEMGWRPPTPGQKRSARPELPRSERPLEARGKRR
jgi:hypothetical protein